MQRIRIVAVDDHYLIRDAIRNNLAAHLDMHLVAEGVAGEDISTLVAKFHPDVLLLDQSMPQFRDEPMGKSFKVLPAIRRLRQEFPDVRIVILSAWADPIMIRQAVRAGVSGYISKSDANLDLAEAIRFVVRNGLFLSETAHMAYAAHAETDLTERQLEVLTSISRNPTARYETLASELNMSESTFKKHLTLAMKRLGVPNNRLAAIKLGERLGLT